MPEGIFEREYEKLNKAQKDAVDSIEGPVMVVAGPGTGKTQILSLRIANILKKTDTESNGILCLTFTNSGVSAMRLRLREYIGKEGDSVTISTFHSFAIGLIEKHYELLDFLKIPELLSDDKAVFLIDEILHAHDWEYLRPRANPSMYFGDLKQLISILKRERITVTEFLSFVEEEIDNLKNNKENISSRGESKGQLKKEVEKKIESLSRTREVVEFYRLYEEKKKELFFMDYDDVLEYATELVEKFEDVRSSLRENYLYVLIDEHQDSSGVQNGFLKAVWGEVEKPNIFVVGDDRQLIYGFSGASISYFEEFAHIFGKAKLITLTENYRSTLPILSLADDLLKSFMTKENLKSNTKGQEKIMLNEYSYPRDEIIGAGIYFKQKIKEGINPNECALLLPRNYQVRLALEILNNMDLPVGSGKNLTLFSAPETESFRRVLGIIASPLNSRLIAESILDKTSNIKPLEAHTFLKNTKPDKLTIEELISLGAKGAENSLFIKESEIVQWGNKLKNWINTFSNEKLSRTISMIGNELLVNNSKENDELLRNIEVVRSFIHLATLFEEKSKNPKLKDFLEYVDRLESYNTHIDLIKFGSDDGIQVMTLHKSKGLEYKCVWIAHMNEEILMSGKKSGFTLPEKIKEHLTERDVEIAKKELYVAITRSKEFCAISYAEENYNGAEMEVAHILRELSDIHFIKKEAKETEKEILTAGSTIYTQIQGKKENDAMKDIKNFVKENYIDRKVSVTALNNFFECPWRWYFRNFLQLPEVKGAGLALGSVVHNTIEFILREKKLGEAEIKNMIEKGLIKEGIDRPAEIKKLSKDAFNAVKNWMDNYYRNIAKDFYSEKSISYKDKRFPHLNIYGKIDLVEYLPNNYIRVTDFKTGSSKTKNVIEKKENDRMSASLRQLAMYSYLISGNEKDKIVSESRLLFLEEDSKNKNSLYSTRINQEEIDLLVKDIEDYDTLMKNGEWVNLPCEYNSYGKNIECPYCVLQKQIIKS
ncbi:MAG: ATP-dependent DNA helicase [Candidatus Paceibacterota bacterium]